MSSKALFRQQYRHRRATQPLLQQQQAAFAVCQQLSGLDCYQAACTIGGYFAVGGELSPLPLMELAARSHKRLCYPVVADFKQGKLRFHAYAPGEGLVKNRYGVLEPLPDSSTEICLQDIDLLLVPLLAFDAEGYRLGMGGGFYDRLLSKRPPACTAVGLAYDWQAMEHVPREAWDQPVDWVVSPHRVWDCVHGTQEGVIKMSNSRSLSSRRRC